MTERQAHAVAVDEQGVESIGYKRTAPLQRIPPTVPGDLGAQWKAAEAAAERKDWPLAASLWESVFSNETDESKRRLAGRRAAQALRRSGDLDRCGQVLAEILANHRGDKLARRELAKLHLGLKEAEAPSAYWQKRKDFIYLHVVKQIALRIGANANAIVDIGSNGTPILEWFPSVPNRYSVDLRRPYRASGIKSVKRDFLEWTPTRRINLGLCLQVLEHIDRAAEFAQHMLDTCDVALVSVPYKWPAGLTKHHVHDPVDEDKLKSWFGRDPNYSYHVSELFGEQRLIVVYDRNDSTKWTSIREEDFLYRWSLKGAEALLGRYGVAAL